MTHMQLKTGGFRATFAALVLAGLTGAVSAQEADPNIDVNGDGFYSFPEVSTVYPEITDDVFSAIDTTGDGLLDMAEVAVAQDAGVMVMGE